MALVNCPECNKQVSDQANTCPNCGFQIAKYYYEKAKEEKQKEQQEIINKRIEQRKKQNEERIKKFKENKLKYILLSCVSLFLIIAIIAGIVFLFNILQIKRFSSEEEMVSYVEGVFYDGEPDDFTSYKITIEDDYITKATHHYRRIDNGDIQDWENDDEMYHISKYDYKNGKLIVDERTDYYSVKDESANDLTSYIEKSKTRKVKDEFIVKITDEIEIGSHTYKKQIE